MNEILRKIAQGWAVNEAVNAHVRPGSGVIEKKELLAETQALTRGLTAPLARLIEEGNTTDIVINGTRAWIDRGRGLEEIPLGLENESQVRALAIRMAACCGKRLDEASPIVDGTLPGGIRMHAVLAPISASGTLISLRVLASHPLPLERLEASGTLHSPLGKLARALIRARSNVLISGATGSGKTTLLSSLLSQVPTDERIICIEEIPEIATHHPHCISLVERHPNVEGQGAVTLSDLVRAAMRMRPDRLVLGECRGPEVRDVLSALNTGHDGGWATIHANGVEEVPARLCALGAGAGMSETQVAQQAGAALDIVIHMKRASGKGGVRRWVAQVGVPVCARGQLTCAMALSVSASGDVLLHEAWAPLAGRLEI